MIVKKISNYNASRYAGDEFEKGHDIEMDIKNYDTDFNTVINCLQGRVRFGAGVSGQPGENIQGKFLTIVTNGVANTESTFTHNMGSIPVGYLIIGQDKAASLYQLNNTGTAWTTSTFSLKCSVATVTFNLFLLK
jgi:hypothetical protein